MKETNSVRIEIHFKRIFFLLRVGLSSLFDAMEINDIYPLPEGFHLGLDKYPHDFSSHTRKELISWGLISSSRELFFG